MSSAQTHPLATPFIPGKPINFDDGWKYLEQTLLHPLREKLSTINDYTTDIQLFKGRDLTVFYSIVYQMRLNSTTMFPQALLHEKLNNYLVKFYKTQSALVKNKTGGDLITSLLVVWKRHTLLSSIIHAVFHYMDRFQHGDAPQVPVKYLILSIFETKVFSIIQEQISDAILDLFHQLRKQLQIEEFFTTNKNAMLVSYDQLLSSSSSSSSSSGQSSPTINDILNLSSLTTTTTTTTTTTSSSMDSIPSDDKYVIANLLKHISDLLIALDPVSLRVYKAFLESKLLVATSEYYQQLGTSCLVFIISQLNATNPLLDQSTNEFNNIEPDVLFQQQHHQQHDPSEFLWNYISKVETILRAERSILQQLLSPSSEPAYISAIHQALIFKTPLLSCNLQTHISVILMRVCAETLLHHSLHTLSEHLHKTMGGGTSPFPSFPVFQSHGKPAIVHFTSLVRLFSVVPNTLSLLADAIRYTIAAIVRGVTRTCFIGGYETTQHEASIYQIELQNLLLAISKPFITILLGIPLRLALTQPNPGRDAHIKRHCLIPSLMLLSLTMLDIFQDFSTASVILKRSHDVAFRDHISKMIKYIYESSTSTDAGSSSSLSSPMQQTLQPPRGVAKTIGAELLATHFDLVLKAMNTTSSSTGSTPSPLAMPLTTPQWVEHLTGAAKFLKLVSDKDVVIEKYRDLLCKRILALGRLDTTHDSRLVQLIASHIGRSKLEQLTQTLVEVDQCGKITEEFYAWLHTTFPPINPSIEQKPIILDKKFPTNGTTPCSTHGVKMSILLISTLSWPKHDLTTGTLVLPYAIFEALTSYTPMSDKGTPAGSTQGKPKGRQVGIASSQHKVSQMTSIRYPSLPFPLNECVRAYTTYYHSKHSFRKLSWVVTKGTVIIGYKLPSGERSVDVKCSTIQAAILLLFNSINTNPDISTRTITLKEVSQQLYIPMESLGTHLRPLCIPNGILCKTPASIETCDESDVISIHMKFNPPPHLPLVQIPPQLGPGFTTGGAGAGGATGTQPTQTTALSQPNQSKPGVSNSNPASGFQQRVLYKRELVVTAQIVRIIKKSPPTHYKELFAKCKQAITQFELTNDLFKICLQDTLDKEYLERTENPMIFRYVP